MHSLSNLLASTDGTGRPKSRISEDRKEENAFKIFPDYSKVNADRHSASRTDSFYTANPPVRTRQGATLASSKVTGDDIASVNSSYLISGLRHDVREIGKEIKSDIQDDVQQSLDLLRQSVQSTLDVVGDTRDSTVAVLLAKLQEDITRILAEAGWPLKVDFSPVTEEIKIGEHMRIQCYKDLMQQMEQRVGEQLAPVISAMPALTKLHDDLKSDFEHTHKRMLEDMLGLRQSIVEVSHAVNLVHRSQLKNTDKIINLEPRFEAQLVKHVQDKPVRVDFEAITNTVHSSNAKLSSQIENVCSELHHLSEEMLTMKTDVAVVGECAASRMTSPGALGDRDSNWAQTDIVETAHGFAQTDDKFWRAKAGQNDDKQKEEKKAKKGSRVEVLHKEEAKAKVKGNVFADAATMKAKARANLIKKRPYNVFDLYHETGVFQRIAKNHTFENMTFFVVVLNALWISIDADYNTADVLVDAHPVFQVAENTFCIYFTTELIIRFIAFKKKVNAFKDPWFVFDFVLVNLMILETWIMSAIFLFMGTSAELLDASVLRLVRIVKIARLSRLARLMRAVPEIIILLKGIGAAARSVASLFSLWLIIIYVFAVFFGQTLEGQVKTESFNTVPTGMNTLLLEGIMPANSGLIDSISVGNPLFWPIILGFVLLASITLSYMLIGVLVQIVHVIADAEQEKSVVESVAGRMRREWTDHGYGDDDVLMQIQLKKFLFSSGVVLFLEEVGVDTVALADMSDMLFEEIRKEKGGVDFQAVVNVVLNLRGPNAASVADFQKNSRFVKHLIEENNDKISDLMRKRFAKCSKQINNVRKAVLGEDDSDSSDSSDDDDVDDLTVTSAMKEPTSPTPAPAAVVCEEG